MSDKVKTSITGYGLVFKRVMKDRNISIEAKALYSYLSAYAGADESAFPSVDLIKHELGIGKHRFLRAKNELIDNGYLMVDRKQTKNIYGSNLYTLFHSPRQADGRPVDDRPAYDRPVDSQPTTNNSITNNNITSNSKTINNSATDVTRERFEEWWKLYDKKLDKKKAFSLFKSALKKHEFETIMNGTREYLKTITDKQYQKYPKTFLSQESYLNDFSEELQPSGMDQLNRMKYDESYWD
ncbi:helix-turn-helix domain-containing protein [Staphylococcus hominis]|uniref:helix-turn-helix domain-containing protein n=1 Tax=Staphylococcus hominis TaxID=1290 RepID=UPI001642C2D5|nr:helix-turn-helix domain-containing protein [Staphylococcus hominis]MBC2908735.1 helix-turn-helix domain-containing protein [Staphylococcus hominis]MBC2911179.1 helix-turn-helix domain-containing protein [Staphylococcus hominis]MBC2913050.1 helix-turn-helix domain-containing protein [Staphylococcus hominis]MBC2935813.1 helix-turn-helix domain-containing protein [Staphylococcus hominis]MBC2949983.1 helix-turn-helix domain-containing protein [Staphylococcus hominis]